MNCQVRHSLASRLHQGRQQQHLMMFRALPSTIIRATSRNLYGRSCMWILRSVWTAYRSSCTIRTSWVVRVPCNASRRPLGAVGPTFRCAFPMAMCHRQTAGSTPAMRIPTALKLILRSWAWMTRRRLATSRSFLAPHRQPLHPHWPTDRATRVIQVDVALSTLVAC